MVSENHVRGWITSLPKIGRITFDSRELKTHFPHMPQKSLDSVIYRLKKCNRIYSARHGFYVIVPDEYALRGFVPPIEYIDHLMKSLDRGYYVALLSAAAIYGSAHQQPQVLHVITDSNQLKSHIKNETSIQFFAKKHISRKYLTEKAIGRDKIILSSPELTSLDLVLYESRIGGLERVAEVLEELSETIDYSRTDTDFWRSFPTTVIQRIGYLWDVIIANSEHSEVVMRKANEAGVIFRKTKLIPGIVENDEVEFDKRWKIGVNESLEVDLW